MGVHLVCVVVDGGAELPRVSSGWWEWCCCKWGCCGARTTDWAVERQSGWTCSVVEMANAVNWPALAATSDYGHTWSDEVVVDFVALAAYDKILDQPQFETLQTLEQDIVQAYCYAAINPVVSRWTRRREYDLNKPPKFYHEAIDRSDATFGVLLWTGKWKVWLLWMLSRRLTFLWGHSTIRLTWVYRTQVWCWWQTHIGQWQGSSGCGWIISAYQHLQCDIRTCCSQHQYPDSPRSCYSCRICSSSNLIARRLSFMPRTVFLCMQALFLATLQQHQGRFGRSWWPYMDSVRLHMSFYMLLMSLLLGLGLIRCEVDHGVFFGEWTSPPDPSISLPAGHQTLFMHLPLHRWWWSCHYQFKAALFLVYCSAFEAASHRWHGWIVLDSWASSLFGIVQIARCSYLPNRTLRKCSTTGIWRTANLLHFLSLASLLNSSLPLLTLSQISLMQTFAPTTCVLQVSSFTLRGSPAPSSSITPCVLPSTMQSPHVPICWWLSIVFVILQGPRTSCLCFGGDESERSPATLAGYLKCVGCSDSDWASDISDRKSISGYCFYYENSLVSWSAAKQKSVARIIDGKLNTMPLHWPWRRAIWMRVFLELNKLPVPKPFPLLSDNQAAIRKNTFFPKAVQVIHTF